MHTCHGPHQISSMITWCDTYSHAKYQTVYTDWEPWRARVGVWEAPLMMREAAFYDMIVPTSDTCRMEVLIRILAETKACVLVTGPPGCGKTISLRQYTDNLDQELFAPRYPAHLLVLFVLSLCALSCRACRPCRHSVHRDNGIPHTSDKCPCACPLAVTFCQPWFYLCVSSAKACNECKQEKSRVYVCVCVSTCDVCQHIYVTMLDYIDKSHTWLCVSYVRFLKWLSSAVSKVVQQRCF
jgi:hypothetical protein